MGKRLKDSPIIEAVFEIQFEPDSPWDLTIPGLVYEKIKADFPRKRTARQFMFGISAGGEVVQQQLQTSDRMQFVRQDEKALIQVGKHLLAVNHLRPYPSWEKFLPLIQQGYAAYRDMAMPTGIHRIGLRYINRLEIPGPSINLEDYFHFYPHIGDGLPQSHGPFGLTVQFPYDKTSMRDFLEVRLTSTDPTAPDTIAIVLDLDYFLAKPREVGLDDVLDWVNTAHQRIEDVFFACLTQRLRQRLGEETD